jgi:hypothetical protein
MKIFRSVILAASICMGGGGETFAQDVQALTCSSAVRANPAFSGDRLPPANLPVGTILTSILDKEHFPCTVAGKWVLADGTRVPDGDRLALLVRFNLVVYAPLVRGNEIHAPDLRGMFLRGKNYERPPADGNAEGDLALGARQSDDVGPHKHGYRVGYANAGGGGSGAQWHSAAGETTGDPTPAGTLRRLETRPRSVTVNYFVRVD